jgi:phosphatidate phosphatase APP1
MITARDVLAPADGPVTLEVEVERRLWPFFDPAIEGAEVEVEGVGRASTDATGEARIDLGIRPAGLHRLRVHHRAKTTEALVGVVARDAPIFITDIDHTIADVSSAGFIFKSVGSVRPLDGAREALERIVQRMQVVYLTARDHIFTRKTKEWLAIQGFPPAPVYLRRRTRFWTVPARDHKVSRLRELRLAFPNIRWGVGDLPGDAEAYREHGIPPILISPHPLPRVPEGTVQVARWSEIAALVAP